MEKTDLRKLNNDELYTIRKQIVRLKKMRFGGSVIEEMTGVNRYSISRIWSTYQKGSIEALKPQISGRKQGDGMLLSPVQEKEVKRTLYDV